MHYQTRLITHTLVQENKMNRQFLTGALVMGVAATAAIVAPQPAEALEVNFGGSAGLFSPVTVDGLTVNASGRTTGGASRAVVRRPLGIGIWNQSISPEGGGSLLPDQLQVDGLGPDEVLELAFSSTVRLKAATFSILASDFNDEFTILFDGSEVFSSLIRTVANGFGTTVQLPGTLPIGDAFGFSVTDANDSYFLKSLEVEVIPTPAAVLPGLVGMGAAAFRKKKQVAEAAQDA
ncbi:MAG: PTPA-CTERM sorting domain-containing protein [Leptolyngbyaceae cyanobacterium SM2_5_2]|nr:PTPA-CTERM sorting domain-containing protein [Leptolyngbyaceae cyanobacterium SM2_5_2]